jgi:hypothetical protein
MLTFARIFPPGRPSRSRILLIAWFFAVLYCICMILGGLHCDPTNISDRHCVKFVYGHPAITYVYTGAYSSGFAVLLLTYVNIAVDTLSIIIMIICPLVVLWRIKLPDLEKRVILVALAGSTMTLLVFGALLILTYAPFHKDSVPYLIVICMLWNMVVSDFFNF